MLKTFITVWAFVRRFRALLGTGILTFIPVFNVFVTWRYAYKHATGGTVRHYYDRMVTNIRGGYPSAFDGHTKSKWADVFAFTSLSAVFIAVSTAVNWYAFGQWPSQFDYEWVVRYNLTYWFQIAGWAVTAAIMISMIGAMLNAIYQAHVEHDPDYMSDDDKRRQANYVEHVLEERRTQRKGAKSDPMN